MIKGFSKIIFSLIFIVEKFLNFLFKRSIIIYLTELIQNVSNNKISVENKKVSFFVPNALIKWRVNTLYSKEPETIEWINKFSKRKKTIFWDIGANIGLYSIYNSIKNKNSLSIAFEPSSSNLRVLSRNISLNKLQKKIKIFSLPLTKNLKGFMPLKERLFQEGGSMNVFGENFNFEGKKFKSEMYYDLFGINIKFLLDNKLLDIPDYIKIDVDGIEHLILEGAGTYLKNKKIKSISVEINENFQLQYLNVLKIMKKNNFILRHKKNNIENFASANQKFFKTYNYIFDKKNIFS
jgi:FkbM family methyltransferase